MPTPSSSRGSSVSRTADVTSVSASSQERP
jgi:hypothetical protein